MLPSRPVVLPDIPDADSVWLFADSGRFGVPPAHRQHADRQPLAYAAPDETTRAPGAYRGWCRHRRSWTDLADNRRTRVLRCRHPDSHRRNWHRRRPDEHTASHACHHRCSSRTRWCSFWTDEHCEAVRRRDRSRSRDRRRRYRRHRQSRLRLHVRDAPRRDRHGGRNPCPSQQTADRKNDRESVVTHANAPLSIEGRRRLVERCKTRPIAHVAAEMGISRPCASKWVNLRRRHSVAGLLDRSSTPRRSLVATPAWVVGVDGSPSSIVALRIARSLTATLSTHLRLVTAWQVPSSAEDVYGSEVVDDEAAQARRLQQEAVGEAFDG